MPLGSIGAGRNDPCYQIGGRIRILLDIEQRHPHFAGVFIWICNVTFFKNARAALLRGYFRQSGLKTPEGYAEMAAAIGEIAKTLPGYIGIESTRDADGFAITVSYWESEEAIKGWREHAKHAIAQKIGKERWYEDYILRVAKVERQYSFK
jgi:heme-degrading monooxygenase HmoA